MRKFIRFFLLFVGMALLLSACSGGNARVGTARSGVGEVKSITLTDSIETTGNLGADQLATLTWGTSGLVEKVNVRVGDTVKKGDRLAALKPDSVPADMLVALADLATAKRDLQDLENSAAEFANAQLAVVNARKEVEEAENNLAALDYPRASTTLIKNTEAKIWDAEKTLTLATRRYKEVQKHPDGDSQKSAALLAMTNAQLALNELKATLNWYLAKPTEADYEEAKAKLDLARANLEEARTQRERLKTGSDQLTLDSAKAQVAAAEARVNAMYILAPFDGEVIAIHTQPESTVSSGSSAIGLINRRTMKIETLIDESSISTISPGDTAEISMESLPDLVLTGKVTLIDPIGKTVSGLVKYTVVVALDPTDAPVLFGATATVKIITSEPHTALAVPIGAVQTDDKGEYLMRMKSDGTSERIDIVSGDLSGNLVTITTAADLKEGDRVQLGVSTDSNNDPQRPGGPGAMPFGGG